MLFNGNMLITIQCHPPAPHPQYFLLIYAYGYSYVIMHFMTPRNVMRLIRNMHRNAYIVVTITHIVGTYYFDREREEMCEKYRIKSSY